VEEGVRRLVRPERFRISVWDDATGATPLDLPKRRMWPIGLMFVAMFDPSPPLGFADGLSSIDVG